MDTFTKMHALEDMLKYKLESPLAATVASLILLRANQLDLLHDWVRNLANWFPFPDGSVLWAEQLMRQQGARDRLIAEAAEYLVRILERGLPHTSEGLSYAVGVCNRLSRLIKHVPEKFRDAIMTLNDRFTATLPYLRPGGLFATYEGFQPGIDPNKLIGPA